MPDKTDYSRKCQQLDVLIDLLEKENKRLREEQAKLITCDKCVARKRGDCICMMRAQRIDLGEAGA